LMALMLGYAKVAIRHDRTLDIFSHLFISMASNKDVEEFLSLERELISCVADLLKEQVKEIGND